MTHNHIYLCEYHALFKLQKYSSASHNRSLFFRMASRIILVLLVVHAAVASNPCCPSGDNRIARKKCADGSPVQLPCPFKYLTKKEDGMTVDVDDDLIIASARIPPDR